MNKIIENLENPENINLLSKVKKFSSFEKFIYVCNEILNLEDKKMDSDLGAKENLNLELIDCLKYLNVSATIQHVEKYNKKKRLLNNICGVELYLKDKKYNLDGLYFADLNLALKNGVINIENLLFNFNQIQDKKIGYNCATSSLHEIMDNLNFYSQINLENGEKVLDEQNLDEKFIAKLFKNNEKIRQKLLKSVENLTEKVYELKAKDKSVEHYLHAYFGEGSLIADEKIYSHFSEILLGIFKSACESELFEELIKYKGIDKKLQEEFLSIFDAPKSVNMEYAQLIKILCENYKDFYPDTIKDILVDAIEDGDYCVSLIDGKLNGSAYFEEYKKLEIAKNILKNYSFSEELKKKDTKIPTLDNILSAENFVLSSKGRNKKDIQKVLDKLQFDDYLENNNWQNNTDKI